MRRLFSGLFLCLFMAGCGEKNTDINQTENPEVGDFIQSFPAIQLPVQFSNANLKERFSDSFYIKSTLVSQFVPDSLFKPDIRSLKKVKFFRKGRYTAEETKETYLFLIAEINAKSWAYLLCFDQENIYRAGMLLASTEVPANIEEEGSLDKRLTVIKNRTRISRDGKNLYNKSAYVYNTEGLFTLILTESNEPVEEKNIYNPIDTLGKKDPLSGDYKIDKYNFVSIRDGGKEGKLNFFIRIEKKGNGCDGSLRGDITQVKPKTYRYNRADDHCILEFTFSGKNNLLVTELEACGNHRGVRCAFDGKYRK